MDVRLLNLKVILVAAEPDATPAAPALAASHLAEAAGASLHAVFVVTSSDGARSADHRQAEAKAAMMAMVRRDGVQIEDTRMHILEGDPAAVIGSMAARCASGRPVVGVGAARPSSCEGRARRGSADRPTRSAVIAWDARVVTDRSRRDRTRADSTCGRHVGRGLSQRRDERQRERNAGNRRLRSRLAARPHCHGNTRARARRGRPTRLGRRVRDECC